eukprot:TRINITY_DN2244_c0_g1_i1.p1 TRINITY_DN2244_c0_g1~~TRINITY_DN2244_c0_g1_i1.p1  ORF type:complete len:275 (-),score=50.78 TRINITY_DN2244_c0_g1_i1:46-804(-)
MDETVIEQHPKIKPKFKILHISKFKENLQFLQKFKAILIYGGYSIENREEFSLLLREYIKNGGGCMVIRASNDCQGPYSLDWTFPHALYKNEVIQNKGGFISCTYSDEKFTNKDKTNPLFKNIDQFTNSCTIHLDLMEDSKLLATWDSGVKLLAYREFGEGKVISASFGCTVQDKNIPIVIWRCIKMINNPVIWKFDTHCKFSKKIQKEIALFLLIISRWNKNQPKTLRIFKPLFCLICNFVSVKRSNYYFN